MSLRTTQQLSLPPTGNRDTWSTVAADTTLPAGTDVIQLVVGPNGSGSINLDNMSIG